MTEVNFHFNTPDKVGYACRLLRKAFGTGAKVVVAGEEDLLRELDAQLWTFSALEFIPHCRAEGAPAAMLECTPVVLSASPRTAPHQDVLVNLGASVPDGFERYARLIEVVSLDDADRQAGRGRWKHYSDRGYAITRHDVATKESA